MSWWFIYWITRLDAINDFFVAVAIISFFCIVSLAWIGFLAEVFSKVVKWIKCSVILMIVFSLLAILTPNLKEAAAIYLIPKMVNNEAVQEIPGDAAKLLKLKLDEWINDLNPSKATSKD